MPSQTRGVRGSIQALHRTRNEPLNPIPLSRSKSEQKPRERLTGSWEGDEPDPVAAGSRFQVFKRLAIHRLRGSDEL